MAGVFEIIKHLNEKTDMEVDMGDYAAFIINRGLSNVRDTIFYANEMNRFGSLDKDQQYLFYKYLIPKGKRYGAWHKKEKSTDDIELLTEYFAINTNVARQYLELMTEEQLDAIRAKMAKGGGKHDRIRSSNKAG